MKLLKLLFASVLILASSATFAQTADEVIEKHIAALGGRDALSKVNSLYMESTLDVMGNQAPAVTYAVNGKGYKSEVEFNGSKIIQCVTDKGGWSVNPMMGSSTPEPMPDDQYKNAKTNLFVTTPLLDYKKNGYAVELLPKEGESIRLKLVSPDKVESVYFLDPASHLLQKVTASANMQGQPVEVTTTFADYKKADGGMMIPHRMEVDLGQFTLSYAVNKIEVNKSIDPSIFEMPK